MKFKLPRTLRNVFTVGGLTALSRLLGLVREMLTSRLIGAGVEQSAFTLAFAIPNMARKLFGEGALTAAFVPVFKGQLARGEAEAAKRLANAVLTLLMLMLGAISILGVLAISAALGWGETLAGTAMSDRIRLILKLLRILFPYMFFICGAAFGMGVLNALGKFAASAFMPALLNLIWIATLGGLCFSPGMCIPTRVMVVSVAILTGGALQMAFLFHCLSRRGFALRLSTHDWNAPAVRQVWHNTAIAAMGAGAIQINYALDQLLGQLAAPWAAGVIGYAERLMDLPLGVIGVAFGTVIFPTLSGHFASGDAERARQSLADAIRNLMFVILPAAAGLCILAPEITAVIYEGKAFDALATTRVARALAVYAVGLGFFGYQKLLVPWFQAQNDMRTPLRVSVMMVVLNAALNVLAVAMLPQEFRHVGLAVSTVLCAFVGCVLLTRLARRGSPIAACRFAGFGVIARQCWPSLAATLAMAAVLRTAKVRCFAGCSPWLGLPMMIAIGALVYFAVVLPLGKLNSRSRALARSRTTSR